MMAHDIVGDNLVAESAAFSFSADKVEEIRKVPFVYLPNFHADLISQHERLAVNNYNSQTIIIRRKPSYPAGLTWHNGAIPESELWVKLGGDKGRGSFKFNLQLANMETPNSMKSTALLSVFKAGDISILPWICTRTT